MRPSPSSAIPRPRRRRQPSWATAPCCALLVTACAAFGARARPGVEPTPAPPSAAVPSGLPLASPTTLPPDMPPPPAQEALPPLVFPAYERFELPNGLAVAVSSRTPLPLATVVLGIVRDPADPTPQAVRHLAASTMAQGGAGRFDAEALQRRLATWGATLDVAVAPGATTWSLTVPSTDLGAALETLAAVVHKPRFDPASFARVRDDEAARLRALARHDDEGPALGALRERLLPAPQAEAASGPSAPALLNTPLAACTTWHRQHVVASAAVLAIVGPSDPLAIRDEVSRHFGQWPPGPPPSAPPPPPPSSPSTAPLAIDVIDVGRTDRSVVVAAWRAPARDAAVRAALELSLDVYCGPRGRLAATADERVLHCSVSGDAASDGVAWVSIETTTDRAAKTLERVLLTAKTLSADALSDAELRAAQRELVGRTLRAWDSTQGVAEELVRRLQLPASAPDDLERSIASVDAGGLRAAAGEWLAPDRVALVVVGDARRLAAPLTRVAPTRVRSSEPATDASR